jgi:hypothetical protein
MRASRLTTTTAVRLLLLSLTACAVLVAIATFEEGDASAVKRTRLVETAKLHLAGEGESTLNERGHATGTFDAPVTAHLDLSIGHVTAVFTLLLKGGSVTGKAEARYVQKGSIVYYGGTLNIVHGTGAYRHASGSNIGISGTINHINFNLTVKANGWISY